MNSKNKGDYGELVVMQEALSRGYHVSVPYGDNARYDLVLDSKSNLRRIQVKCYKPKNGKIEVALCTVMHNKNKNDTRKYKRVPYNLSEIDALAVVNSDNNETYLVPAEDLVGLKSITLRVEKSTKLHPKTRWAKDYLKW